MLKEFAHMFGSSWVLLATPEAGFGVLAMMEMQLPVIALARNEAHTRALEAIVDERLANAMLDEQSVFTNPALTKLWIDAGGRTRKRRRRGGVYEEDLKDEPPRSSNSKGSGRGKGGKASADDVKTEVHSDGEEDSEEEDREIDPVLPGAPNAALRLLLNK